MTVITSLDTILTILHDRGIVNEDALREVCAELLAASDDGDDVIPTTDQLVRIFGQLAIYKRLTVHDATKVQLLREAIDILTNHECRLDLRDWVKAAETIVGPRTNT